MLHFTSKCNKNKHHLKCNFTPDWEKWKCLTTPHSEKKAEKKNLHILIGWKIGPATLGAVVQ